MLVGLGLGLSGLRGLRVQKVRKAPLVLMVRRGQLAQIPRCRAPKERLAPKALPALLAQIPPSPALKGKPAQMVRLVLMELPGLRAPQSYPLTLAILQS